MGQIYSKLKVVILLLIFAGVSTLTFAQLVNVTGTVVDATDGSSLAGVTVLQKGTSNGTVTNMDGQYSLNVDMGQTLVFSFVGYSNQEIMVDRLLINVQLAEQTELLSEFVVIGYGIQKKDDATGSIVAIGSDDFNKGGTITSAQDLLVGKGAGVVITSAGGAPGSGSTIRIRGGSSLNASNDPLIIIDGIPIDNNNVSGSSNFLSFVNPNDIESFSILKDASATAIYGSRASNGVIIITTKKGKVGSPMVINFDMNTSVASAVEFIDVYSGDELRQIALNHQDLYGAESFNALWDGNTNWQNEIFRTALSQDNNLSLAGAYKNLPYRVSIGHTNQNGIMDNTSMKRLTGSVSLNPTLLDGDLKVNMNLKGMNTAHNYGDAGALGSAINMDPTKPIYDDSFTNSQGYFQWNNYGANLGTPNPVEQLMSVDNRSDVKRWVGNLQLDYKIPFIPELHANLNLAKDVSSSEGHNNRPVTSPSNLTAPYSGRLENYDADNKNTLLDFYLNYKKDLNSINSVIDATAGYSWQHFEREGNNHTRGIRHIGETYQGDKSGFITENFLVSFFGRLNYSLADRYLVTVTVRNDGSSRFSKDNQWGLFPSAAFAWKINEESFLRDVDAITNLKLRIGWGITGQQDIGNDYPAQATYVTSSEGSYYMIDGEYIPTLRPNAYDPNIKWEETTTQNIGLDFGFLKDRITGSFDIYKRVTDDLLNTVTVATGSNFSNKLLTNVGSLENKGAELALNLIPISRDDMSLQIGFNTSYNENKITKLLVNDDPNYIGILYGDAFTGQTQVTRVGYPAYSFFLNQQVYDANGNPIEGMYVDLSGDGGTVGGDNNDKYIYHSPVADVLFGLSARFSYKDFDFSASTRTSIGNYVYNQVAAGASYDQMYQIGYWKNFPKYLDETQFVKRQFTSDFFVSNASFFKLDNLSIGYTPSGMKGKLKPRFSFTVSNVLTITNYKGLDPEVPGGIDNNFYPRPRTFMVGIGFTY